MKKLALIFLTATMAFGSGAALAAGSSSDSGSSSDNNGLSNQSGSPGAKENLPPASVDNNQINTGSTDTSGNTSIDQGSSNKQGTGDTSTATGSTDANEAHKDTICKDGRCPDQTPGSSEADATSK
ncbi:MAG: protein YbgS [Yersiniaceae bacterium]|uniref:Homeobox protein YbgS n=1 Tax=Chimaeribacter coloradensis TaxID=2060068 RepID=A0A2N5DV40_9GAMM|nr:protein YbgS [Chimaeribacter coloradensis]MDU6409856.1 protein YbgS [Yersiniaceae bacterium]PLR30847.1 hypothetical protein CYR32_17765 [Chimaeribacter coloradensis]